MTNTESSDIAQAAAAALRASLADGSSSSSMLAEAPNNADLTPAPVTPPASMSFLLQQVCTEAGADHALIAYMTARGISNHHKMANLAENVADLEERLVDKWIHGHEIAGRTHKNTDDAALARAVIVSIWRLTRNISHQPSDQIPLTQGPAVTSTTLDNFKKAPSILAPGIWNEQIAKYNSVIIQGQAREFPEKTLLGAENILARMIYEKQHKMFQPLKLGEILSTRAYTATLEVNSLALRTKRKHDLIYTDGTLQSAEREPYNPATLMGVCDAVEANMWAMIFCEWGTERAVMRWRDFFVVQARNNPSKLDNLRTMWTRHNWELCLAMRSGTSFEAACKDILLDVATTQHIMMSPPIREYVQHHDDRRVRPRPQDNQGVFSNQVCRAYNQGRCNVPNCPRKHMCAHCHKPNHTESQCFAKNPSLKASKPKGKGKGKSKGKGSK